MENSLLQLIEEFFTEKQLSKANLVVDKITPEIILEASESL